MLLRDLEKILKDRDKTNIIISVEYGKDISNKRDISILNEGLSNQELNRIKHFSCGIIKIEIYNNILKYVDQERMFSRYDYLDGKYTINDMIYDSDIIDKLYKERYIILNEDIYYGDENNNKVSSNNIIREVNNIYDNIIDNFIKDNINYLTDNKWSYIITNQGVL